MEVKGTVDRSLFSGYFFVSFILLFYRNVISNSLFHFHPKIVSLLVQSDELLRVQPNITLIHEEQV